MKSNAIAPYSLACMFPVYGQPVTVTEASFSFSRKPSKMQASISSSLSRRP